MNVDKCKVLHFGKHYLQTQYSVRSGVISERVVENDLGVLVDPDLKFNVHVKQLVRKVYGVMNTLFKVLKMRDRRALICVYKVFVRSIVEYGSQIYSPHCVADIECLERLQRYFTRRIFGRGSNLKYSERLLKLKLPLEPRRLQIDLVTLYKIIHVT